ncbi:hypothetical protein ACHQM5_017340 [Ranunculus cassubicifolius]
MESQQPDQVVLPLDQLVPNSQPDEVEHVNPPKTRTLTRLHFSKPKSRFIEGNHPLPSRPDTVYEHIQPFQHDSESSHEDDDDFDKQEHELQEQDHAQIKKRRKKRNIKWGAMIEWVLFFFISAALLCSLTIEPLKDKKKYGVEIWKWCLMMMGLISGRLVSGWLVRMLVFLIERNFMLREKVLYFVYGLRKSFQNQLWLGLVLLAWSKMFSHDEVEKHHKILKTIFNLLIATLIGATIWLLKILAVKILASSFHVATFFDRMKESVFHHYILEALSRPPLDNSKTTMPITAKYAKKSSSLARAETRKIDMDKLRKLSMESTASAWGVKRLVNYVMSSGLSTISKTVDEFGKYESDILSEKEARTCAQRTFANIAKPRVKYIDEEDLLRFLKREEVDTIFPFFEGATETGQIRKSAFRNWVVRAYRERKFLVHSLNDTKTAVQQLHKLASAIVIVIIIVVFVLVMGLATSKIILVITSQLLLVGFMFQNTCKTVFESIIFVFVMHPFDVGDRCVIDGIQMIVEEMNILTTVFLRYDNEKIFYPNSVLSTKPISNFYRSPEMSDSVDFTIDVSTSMENVNALKKQIQEYIESKPKHWNPKHSVIVKEIENVNKMKMALYVVHTMNHQNYGEKSARRSDLILELKKIFERLGVKYNLLPQEVHLS